MRWCQLFQFSKKSKSKSTKLGETWRAGWQVREQHDMIGGGGRSGKSRNYKFLRPWRGGFVFLKVKVKIMEDLEEWGGEGAGLA